jgi:hypothetical protein
VGAQALPHDGRPRSARKTKPTTFETLTYLKRLSLAHRVKLSVNHSYVYPEARTAKAREPSAVVAWRRIE